jgi:hypothetical protein
LIRYHAELDKIGQATFFRVKVTAHDVNETSSKKNCALPFVALCLIQNHKLPTARRAATQARETPAGSPAAFYAD